MKLINMLPPVHQSSKETVAMIEAMQPVADKLIEIFEEFTNEMYAHSAEKSLALWEKMCGIPIASGKSLENRRSAIMSKLRGSGTCTKQKLCDIALAFDCGEIEIEEVIKEYTITIRFISKWGSPQRITEFKAAIETAKPAHIKVNYEFSYRRWGEYAHKLWGDLSGYTWQEVKEMGVIE